MSKQQSKQDADFNAALGQRVRAQRIMAGIKQGELALSLGVCPQQLYKLEHGVNRISAHQLVAISDLLGVPLLSLLAPDTVRPALRRADLTLSRRLTALTCKQKQAVAALLDSFTINQVTKGL